MWHRSDSKRMNELLGNWPTVSCFDRYLLVAEESRGVGGDVPPGSCLQVAVTRWGPRRHFSPRSQIVDLVSESCFESDLQGPTGAKGHNPPPTCPLVIYLLCRVLIIVACCIFPGIQQSDGMKISSCGLQLLRVNQRAETILPGQESHFWMGAGPPRCCCGCWCCGTRGESERQSSLAALSLGAFGICFLCQLLWVVDCQCKGFTVLGEVPEKVLQWSLWGSPRLSEGFFPVLNIQVQFLRRFLGLPHYTRMQQSEKGFLVLKSFLYRLFFVCLQFAKTEFMCLVYL